MVLAAGAGPREVAEFFYRAIEQDDYEAFKEAVIALYRNQLNKNIRGVSPEFWWESGRRYVTEYGVNWRYEKVGVEEAKYVKLFFQRKHADGSNRGLPIPIHLKIDEDGEWRVDTATV